LEHFESGDFESALKPDSRINGFIIRQTGLCQTLRINIRNLRNFTKKYISSQNDLIFTPLTERFRTMYQQTGYDQNYTRLTLEEIESQIQLLDLQTSQKHLKVEQRREKSQRRIEYMLAIVTVFLSISEATVNMQSGIRLAIMFTGAMLITLIWWLIWRVPPGAEE
jgi:hypothetical protein